uniref:Uncharacterized protein n=1 Tax=Nelumbo nucifera TaxID=4432 RepID=A0A822Y936_NELNU|nr:TPA_asm: hypothetical protein HUJ06_029013 [Nelumbo nucifera]
MCLLFPIRKASLGEKNLSFHFFKTSMCPLSKTP